MGFRITSLPEAEWVNGFAEIIKHASIKDNKQFEFLSSKNLLLISTFTGFSPATYFSGCIICSVETGGLLYNFEKSCQPPNSFFI
ncbi:MAG: hypothetical protein EOO43_15335 [Flavobacterium sp.]|nr:MAG: hypothetical protein EOO43_15335 [Flavobacterium sp.]